MKRRDPRQRQRQHIARILQPATDDPYFALAKPNGSARCPDCGVVFLRGRWQWAPAPARGKEQVCPACRRVRERNPAGYVRLSGAFFTQHRDEILALARNTEAREKQAHPMERIMQMRELAEGVEITTTGLHLARRIGDAVASAYRGNLSVRHAPDQYLVRIAWSRA